MARDHRLTQLREAFDHAFALPRQHALQETADLLLVRVGGDPFAIRLAEVAGVLTPRKLAHVPGTHPHLLGVAGVRGSVAPVFSLSSVLGYPPEAARWLVLCNGDEPLVLGLAELEGYERVPTSSVSADPDAHASARHSTHIARTDRGLYRIVSVPLVVASLHRHAHPDRSDKEQ